MAEEPEAAEHAAGAQVANSLSDFDLEAAAGEKGEVVIRRPYPYMALTVRRPRCDRAHEGMRRANGVAEP